MPRAIGRTVHDVREEGVSVDPIEKIPVLVGHLPTSGTEAGYRDASTPLIGYAGGRATRARQASDPQTFQTASAYRDPSPDRCR